MILDHEMATYRSRLPELLKRDAGRWVVIHGDDLIGVYDTEEQAMEEGDERFLLEAFLVKQIVAVDKPIRIG
jgi:hypothetical protein